MTDPDRCPLCGSTRFTMDEIDVSSELRVRHVPGLRSCLDCHDGGAPVLLAEVTRLRGLLALLEWASQEFWDYEATAEACPACKRFKEANVYGIAAANVGHEPDCWLAAELGNAESGPAPHQGDTGPQH